jgi:hypothetical protein
MTVTSMIIAMNAPRMPAATLGCETVRQVAWP